MALQGTLDTFALPEVLRLLASSKKVGRLRVSGDGGSGSLWVDTGNVAGGELLVRGAEADSFTEVLFHLLRFTQGSFTFEAGALPPSPDPLRDVESVIVEGELMLAEWRALELVVPSLEARLCLSQELTGRDVVVDAARWRIIVTIGSGATVGEVGRSVGLGALPVMRAVKEVIELGLVEVSTEAAPADPVDTTYASQIIEPEPAPSFEDFADAPFDDEDASAVFAHETPIAPPSLAEMRAGLGAMTLSDEAPLRRTFDEPGGESAEIARQLASLSPRAAKAVAAAARATTDDEREAALTAIEAEDETINRGLLLKYLGAVEG